MAARPRMAVLASGRGSNMDAIADACAAGSIEADLVLVVSNEPDAPVLELARTRGLNHRCISHREFADRASFDAALLAELKKMRVDLVVLAGFMRILTDAFVGEYYGSLLNIHPSLLPKYPGLNTHQRAIDAGDREAGTTVHFVIPALDAGPTIAQARVPIVAGDDAATLAARVQREEHRLYPQAIQWCVSGQVVLRDGQVYRHDEHSRDSHTDSRSGKGTGKGTGKAADDHPARN